MNYNMKFKEREPEETVEVIKNFFDSINFKTKVNMLNQAESSTWSCAIELYTPDGKLYFS